MTILEFDILQHEIDTGMPHWLSPAMRKFPAAPERERSTRDDFKSSEPRKSDGEWTTGGSAGQHVEVHVAHGAASGPDETSHPGHGYSPDARMVGGKIHTSNPYDAVRALYENRPVELSQPRQLTVVVEKLTAIANEMQKLGGKAPEFNFCNVTVAGTNLFCADSKGIPRAQMPQIPSKLMEGFKAYLLSAGHKITPDKEAPGFLRATQNQLNGIKVGELLTKFQSLPKGDPLLSKAVVVSKDNYVLDGHHYWAAKVAFDAADNKLGNMKMNVNRVDIGIVDLMKAAMDYTKGAGRKSIGDSLKALRVAMRDDGPVDEPRKADGEWTAGGGSKFTPPKKTTKAYKLFEIRKNEPGKLYPLFIGRNEDTPIGQWIPAEHIPTKGFAERPGWHAGVLPTAPHLRTKSNVMAQNRVWAEVEMPDDVDWQKKADLSATGDIRHAVPDGGHYRFKTSKMQGGAWMIGGAIKVNRILTDKEVASILNAAGHGDEAAHERHIDLTDNQKAALKAIIGKTHDAFEEAEHPRGQPKNPGQFSKVEVHVSKHEHAKGTHTKVDVKATPHPDAIKGNLTAPTIPTKEEIDRVVAMSKLPIDEIQKSVNKFIGKNFIFFHGTSAQAAADILKHGIVPHGGPGGDVWAVKHGLATGNWQDEDKSLGRSASVYMTQNPAMACIYAQISAGLTNTQPVILAVTVPPDQQGNVRRDERDSNPASASMRFEGSIKPEWIAPAILPVPKNAPTPAQAFGTKDAAAPSFYIVVLADGKQTTSDAYDPNEPRGQPENAGEWTKSSHVSNIATEVKHTSNLPSQTPEHHVDPNVLPALQKALQTHQNATGSFALNNGATTVKGPPGTSVQTSVAHHPNIKIIKNIGETSNAPVQLSWESTPGMTAVNHMTAMHNAPLAQRREFHNAMEKALTDDQGHDLIAQGFGMDVMPSFQGPGVFEGRTNPGEQAQVNLPDKDITRSHGGLVVSKLSPDDIAKLNACEATRGMLLRQDAAAWHKPKFAPQGGAYLIPTLKFNGKLYAGGPTHKEAFATMSPEEKSAFITSKAVNDRKNYAYTNEKGAVLDGFAGRTYAEENGLLSPIGAQWKQKDLIAEHLSRDASCPHQRLRTTDANLLDFRLGRSLTDDEAVAVTKALSSVAGGFYTPIASQQGFRLLNVPDATGLDNVAFKRQVVQTLEAMDSDTLGEITLHAAQADSGYISNDWTEHPHGEDYRATVAGYNRPDLARTSDELLASLGPKVAAVEDDFAKRYGWEPDRNTRVWEQPAQSNAAGQVTHQVVQGVVGQPLHIQDFRYIIRDEYDPNEKRVIGGKNAGEWTSGGQSVVSAPPAVRSLPAGAHEQLAAIAASVNKQYSPRPASELLEHSLASRKSPSAEQIVAENGYAASLSIDVARARIASAPATDSTPEHGGFKLKEGFYTPAREAIHEKIINDFLTPERIAAATPQAGQKPTAVFLGGRGGSGKSWLTGDGHIVDKSKFILVDPDEIKAKLPGYQGWNAGLFHEESSDVASRITTYCNKLGLNVIYDATMRTQSSLEKKINGLLSQGYKIEGYYMYASPETAAKRAVKRFQETGRYVPPEYILSSTTNEQTFDAVKDKFSKWAVFDNDAPSFKPKKVAEGVGQATA